MKNNIGIMMLVVLFAGISLVNAEGMKDGVKGKGMKCSMMGKGMMDDKMMGMCPMMKSMMERTVVATSDGGVVVVMCNKLTKYDKNLNLVKEAELKMDMDGMKMMMEHMKDCPMMGNMDKNTKATIETKVTTKEVDHVSHH